MAMPSLPPGFRFHPTDVELVGYYLKRKVTGKAFYSYAISEIELYKFAPWDLPDKSLLRSGDLEWYFFCPRDIKYPNSIRARRATDIGFWKSTGNDRPIIHGSRSIGMKKTLVFHLGKAPRGVRTDWVMYEYRLTDVDAGFSKDAFVLCKIFNKSGAGPKIGEQYGAPFNEKEWEDEIAEDPTSLPHSSSPSSTLLDNPAVLQNTVLEQSAASGGGDVLSNSEIADGGFWLEELADILNLSPVVENDLSKIPGSEVPCQSATQASTSEPKGIFDRLEDLSAEMLRSTNYSQGIYNEYDDLLPMLSDTDFEQYMELNDFQTPVEKYFPL